MMDKMNLAANLEGITVDRWTILNKMSSNGSTGGAFSIGYEVADKLGNKAFLKALDYSEAFGKPNMAEILNGMTSAFLFEKELLLKCHEKHLRYVVKIIDSGHFVLPQEHHLYNRVIFNEFDYIVFEKANQSVRTIIDLSKIIDSAWALRSLHNIAVGIEEMHGIQVAHQDIKPSNVLLFNNNDLSKIGDVGRSSSLGTHAIHDNYNYAGDPKYSPFELLYGQINDDWKIRRYSCDMYMFGNLIYTYFNNISLTMAVLMKLPRENWYKEWTETYESILPQIELAFAESIEEFNHSVDANLRKELVLMINQLCNPRVMDRGDKKSPGVSQYSLRRYISKLDLLARRYEYKLKMVEI